MISLATIIMSYGSILSQLILTSMWEEGISTDERLNILMVCMLTMLKTQWILNRTGWWNIQKFCLSKLISTDDNTNWIEYAYNGFKNQHLHAKFRLLKILTFHVYSHFFLNKSKGGVSVLMKNNILKAEFSLQHCVHSENQMYFINWIISDYTALVCSLIFSPIWKYLDSLP